MCGRFALNENPRKLAVPGCGMMWGWLSGWVEKPIPTFLTGGVGAGHAREKVFAGMARSYKDRPLQRR